MLPTFPIPAILVIERLGSPGNSSLWDRQGRDGCILLPHAQSDAGSTFVHNPVKHYHCLLCTADGVAASCSEAGRYGGLAASSEGSFTRPGLQYASFGRDYPVRW